MHIITFGRKNHLYIANGEQIPEMIEDENITWNIDDIPKYIVSIKDKATDWRPIIVKDVTNSGKAYLYYLYWHSDIDLLQLDTKIKSGEANILDFENAIFAEYQCLVCVQGQSWWHTLSIPRTTFLFTGLADQDFANRADFKIVNCPYTDESFRQEVIKILGVATPPRQH